MSGAPFFRYMAACDLFTALRRGCLEPGPSFVGVPARPAVWCSSSLEWDACTRLLVTRPNGTRELVDRRELEEEGHALARVVLPPSALPLSWRDFVETVGLPLAHVERVERLARSEVGSDPGAWRASLEPVMGRDWIRVEVLGPNGWRPPQRARARHLAGPAR